MIQKKSKNWRDKFMYIFGQPGWSHDGSTITVKQMQRELKQDKRKKKKAKFKIIRKAS